MHAIVYNMCACWCWVLIFFVAVLYAHTQVYLPNKLGSVVYWNVVMKSARDTVNKGGKQFLMRETQPQLSGALFCEKHERGKEVGTFSH